MMPSTNAHSTVFIAMFLLTSHHLTAPSSLVTAYVINTNSLTAPHQPTSSLASKVIYESPSMENIYKEFIVASKPLNLRKYANGMKKKTRKDSKIYYIPIPPLPYRYIPGVGYDYQPMKINPIMMESPQTTPSPPTPSLVGLGNVPSGFGSPQQQYHQPQQQQIQTQTKPQQNYPKYPLTAGQNISSAAASKPDMSGGGQANKYYTVTDGNSTGESKIFRMHHRNDYFFNGRPFRLQVAHAQSKHQLTPQNLKSKLYFNKKFIY